MERNESPYPLPVTYCETQLSIFYFRRSFLYHESKIFNQIDPSSFLTNKVSLNLISPAFISSFTCFCLFVSFPFPKIITFALFHPRIPRQKQFNKKSVTANGIFNLNFAIYIAPMLILLLLLYSQQKKKQQQPCHRICRWNMSHCSAILPFFTRHTLQPFLSLHTDRCASQQPFTHSECRGGEIGGTGEEKEDEDEDEFENRNWITAT